MRSNLQLVDFHAHLQDSVTQCSLCPEDQQSLFFKTTAPLLEMVAHHSEPLHDEVVSFLALNYRDPISRFIYSQFGPVGLMEVLRLFKTCGLFRLLSNMDRFGIQHVVVHSIEPLTKTANLIQLTSAYRSRISIFVSVDRNEPNPVSYVTPFLEANAVAGLKIHPIVGNYACGELFHKTQDLIELFQEAGLPVLIHTGHIPVDALNGLSGCSEVRALEPMIASFPRQQFILAHIGWESWRQVLQLAQKYPNVLVETSWQPAKIIRRAVDALGPERVLFGSDYPLFKQSAALVQTRMALTRGEFALVASENARRILKLDERVSGGLLAS